VFESKNARSGTTVLPHQCLLDSATSRSAWFRRLMRLDEKAASFSVRGFQTSSPRAQVHLEIVGRTFIRGYNLVIERRGINEVEDALNEVEPDLSGFAFEGASMALCLLDMLSIRPFRFSQLLNGPGQQYKHLCWVGSGWACARLSQLHFRLRKKFFLTDPLLSMLAYDGWGFHEGYFFSSRYLKSCRTPTTRLKAYARRVFDQGFGRSLWFVGGANPSAIKSMISRYAFERQADLWSGIGLACAYAGGTDHLGMESLLAIHPALLPHLRQGVAFGAAARVHSHNVTEDTVFAAKTLCASTPEELAECTEVAQARSSDYRQWRSDIQQCFV
jgi:hypothetical protein